MTSTSLTVNSLTEITLTLTSLTVYSLTVTSVTVTSLTMTSLTVNRFTVTTVTVYSLTDVFAWLWFSCVIEFYSKAKRNFLKSGVQGFLPEIYYMIKGSPSVVSYRISVKAEDLSKALDPCVLRMATTCQS